MSAATISTSELRLHHDNKKGFYTPDQINSNSANWAAWPLPHHCCLESLVIKYQVCDVLLAANFERTFWRAIFLAGRPPRIYHRMGRGGSVRLLSSLPGVWPWDGDSVILVRRMGRGSGRSTYRHNAFLSFSSSFYRIHVCGHFLYSGCVLIS